MHVHLDTQGGISGDMFLASLLDARPGLEQPLRGVLNALPLDIIPEFALIRSVDQGLRGSRVIVEDLKPDRHSHRSWADIRRLLEQSRLAAGVIQNAVGIFRLLAAAEAAVHGVQEESVVFHEVGAVDSIIDIVGAAFLIDTLKIGSWSVSALPLGSGRIRSAHGFLPIPAPATAFLLAGYVTFDDGIPGERVTPTGAAILRHLECRQEPQRFPRRLVQTGVGLGSRALPGMSNCLRALLFETAQDVAPHRELAVFEFEVDDQSPEDLAVGLERLRSVPGVFDALQIAAHGKKGRMTSHIQLIVSPEHIEPVASACFEETTTIGLRYRFVQAVALSRQMNDVDVGGRRLRIKVVSRPSAGRTAKADIADVAAAGGHAARASARRAAEDTALASGKEQDDE